MKKFFIIQWLGSDKYYVKKTYCKNVVLASSKVDAKYFDKKTADKYLIKLKTLNPFGEFSVRQTL